MDMDSHQRPPQQGGDCELHYLLDGKIVDCPLGCGEQVTFFQQMDHLSLFCANRLVQCPRREGCSESLPFRQLSAHASVCPARCVPCGAESHDCKRSLRMWLEQRAACPTRRASQDNGHITGGENQNALALIPQEGENALALVPQDENAWALVAVPSEEGEEGNGFSQTGTHVVELPSEASSGMHWSMDSSAEGDGEGADCWLVACEQHGSTALAWAVQHDDVTLARYFLDLLSSYGHRVVARECGKEDIVTGVTPLVLACARGRNEIVQLMLERVRPTVLFHTYRYAYMNICYIDAVGATHGRRTAT